MTTPLPIPGSLSAITTSLSTRLLTHATVLACQKLTPSSKNSRLQRLINGIPRGNEPDAWGPICMRAKEGVTHFWDLSYVVQYDPSTEQIVPNRESFKAIHLCLELIPY